MGNDNKVAAKWKFNWDDENTAESMLVGRKIINVEKVDEFRADLVLDNGTKVAVTGNMGSCCSNGDVTIEKLYEGEVTGRIMGINVVDREIEYRDNRITLFIMVVRWRRGVGVVLRVWLHRLCDRVRYTPL